MNASPDISTELPFINSPYNLLVAALLVVVIAVFVIVAAKKRK